MTKATPTEAVARDASNAAGLDTDGLRLLGDHATAVHLLPRERLVVRVRGPQTLESAIRAVALTRRLDGYDLPVTRPARSLEPVVHDGHVLTWWEYYPQPPGWRPDAAELGSILRRLHALPQPPEPPPTYRPLADLADRVAASTTLDQTDKAWLAARIDTLLERYEHLTFPLGPAGLIHGDAYPGNLLADRHLTRLGDWDEAAHGPRELDLVNTYQGTRFGRGEPELERFADAYGFDPRRWDGFSVLREMRDLHTLGSFIRRADARDRNAHRELAHRITTLRTGDEQARWAPA
ncbi:hypothetical protein B4N89_45830 [Embleya scabrispora]|uniref:Aminoglycoside phosphotransferase domain-containing protein n=1 Tax=Embleya scabrispora TaxID=159449 RepID=A0A1T3NJ93_9ACTN|nr:aminoglycoside phosphotransferase family protein [Embleya scabrispora]OPC76798.1 hypothetical protein B4N89_45830 [Embleya scabrispora]